MQAADIQVDTMGGVKFSMKTLQHVGHPSPKETLNGVALDTMHGRMIYDRRIRKNN